MTGWTIADTGLWYSRTGTSWTARPFALRLRVNGTAVGGTPPVSTDATLSGLAVNDGTKDLALNPTFASDKYTYTASVASTVAEVTVTPTLNDDGAMIVWLDGSDMTLDDADTADGQQVTLAEGDNVINVKVTAADGSTTLTYTVTVNRLAAATTPSITNVAVTSSPVLESDTYGAGETIRFTVTFDVAVEVAGDPVFTFSLGSPGNIRNVDAAYESGSGTAALVFGYTVVSTDMDSNGIYQLGGSDFDSRDGPVDLDSDDSITLTGTSTDASLAYATRVQQSDHKVNGSLSIDSVAVSSTPVLESDTYGAGETIKFTVTFTAAVDVTGDPVFRFALGNSGAAVAKDAAYESGSGSTALVFGYTVQAGDMDSNGIYLYDGTDLDNPDGPVRLDSDDSIQFTGTSTDVPLEWPSGRAGQSGHKVDGSQTPAATTCTLNTGDIWCGVVTVALYTAGGLDLGYGFVDAATDTGALSDKEFSVGTNSYTIDDVWTGVGSLAGALNFGLTSILTAADQAKLVLHVDSTSFAFSAATGPDSAQAYRWGSAGLDWSSTSSVTLRLREATAAAVPAAPTNFTATVGDTQVALAWDPPASDSGVTGHEFRYKTDGSYPANWTAIANSAVGGANQAAFTVTGLTNEVAHTFELHAVNDSGAGGAATAGPVTPTPGICDRTQQIQVAILAEISGVDDCAAVTVAHLASITEFGGLGTGTANQGISSLKKGDFAGLTSLTILNLSRNALVSLPEGIFAGLAELTYLNLDQNQLATLPEAVFDGLVKLEDIGLGGNSLTGLRADEFSELTALKDLNLGFNELSSLPDEVFSDLTTLNGLSLSNNDLSSLDAVLFSDLTALTHLELSYNDLGSLDAALFSDLTALTDLSLNNNELGSLDAALFTGLTALDDLDLSSSNLSSLPDGVFSDLTALTQLYLYGNTLSSLPEELFLGLTSLRTLHMYGNTNTMPLTVTVEKVGTNQVRAKVLAGAPFAVAIPVTLVNGTLTGSVTELSVAAGSVEGTAVTMTRTGGTTTAVTVDVDLTTQPTLPANHRGYEFARASSGLPATVLPDANNAAPAFTSSTTFKPAENQTAVGTVEAEDSDTTDDITGYELSSGADQALFSINDSGVLTFQVAPNYEDPQDANTDNAYVVVVRATSGTGAREQTADQTITVTVMDVAEQPDKPAKPTLEAVSGSATSLDASWTEPGLNGGPAINGYEVDYREGTSGNWVNFTHSGAGVTSTITGLRGNTEHQVRVRALNGETPSAWSDPSEAVSTNSAADAPTVESVAVKSVPQSGDTYGWGETIVFTLTFSQKVRVTGQPQPTLAFDLGGSTRDARYAGMSDTDVDSDPRPRPRPEGVKVHFYYTVQSGDQDNDGIQVGELASAIDLRGARIRSVPDGVDADGHKVDGVDAVHAHAALGQLSDHRVDGGTAQPPAGSGITIIDTYGNPLTDNRLTLRENTRGRYGFKLNTRPTHTVWVSAIASDGDPDLQVLPTANATKAITPDEWETPFYMELRAAIDDDEEIGERVFVNRSSSRDPAYHDLILPDVVVVEDERADDAGALSVADAEARESVDETLDFVVTLHRRPSRDWEATVDYRTQDGTATAGSDYTLMSGTLTFAPGEDEKTVSVPIADDTVEDSGETLTLVLSNATGAGFASFGREAVGTIWNTETAATGTPTISGTPQVGETLTADTLGIADDDGLENVSFSYQWLADGTAIQGATNSTYTPIEADEGKAITVQVSFTDDAGNEETLTSEPTAVVAPKPNTTATGAPTISGTAQVGETLTADTSGISDADRLTSVTHSYQWLADDTAIQGATNTTYTLVEADEGKAIKVRVSFTDDGGNDETLTSAATDAVAGNEEPLTSARTLPPGRRP